MMEDEGLQDVDVDDVTAGNGSGRTSTLAGAGNSFKSKFSKLATRAMDASKKAGSAIATQSVKLGTAVADKSSDLVDKAKSMKKPDFMKRTDSVSSPTSSPSQRSLPEVNKATIVFGAPLADAVRISRFSADIELPAIVEQCIAYLEERGLREEGIYRIPGSTSQVNNLKHLFDSGQRIVLENEIGDPHGVAGLLKLYFRELPEPLLTRELTTEFQQVAAIVDEQERRRQMRDLHKRLPSCNFAVMSRLMRHLNKVAENSDANKMTVSNLGVVFSVCLDIAPMLFKCLISDVDTFYPTPYPTPLGATFDDLAEDVWDDGKSPMFGSNVTGANATVPPPKPPKPKSRPSSGVGDFKSNKAVAASKDKKRTDMSAAATADDGLNELDDLMQDKFFQSDIDSF